MAHFSRYADTLARVAERNMPDVATVTRNTRVSDGAGGTTDVWTEVPQPWPELPVRVASTGQTPQERAIAEREAFDRIVRLSFPRGADVRPGDRVTTRGWTFRIVADLPEAHPTMVRVVAVG